MIIGHQLIDIAEQRDQEFEDAIKSQFGKNANRFDHDRSEYNEATREAYERKVIADEAVHFHYHKQHAY